MRYYCPHGSYSEYQAERCEQCRKRAKVLAMGDLRACADCIAYAPIKVMITKPDGRVICPACQKAIEAQTRERDQGALFVTQPALF